MILEAIKKIISRYRTSGVRLGVMNNVLTFLALLISAALLYATAQSITSYDRLRAAMERYITCQQDALIFQEGSDYLTNEVRYFVVSGDAAHAHNFIEEVDVTRRRQRAVESIDEFLREEGSYNYLATAMDFSDDLVVVEYYAMRLAAAGYGIDPAVLPERIARVALTDEDSALPADQQRAAAIDLVFGEAYQASKNSIYENVEKSITALIENSKNSLMGFSDNLNGILQRQRVLLIALMAALFAIVLATYLLVIRPLRHGVARIRNHQEIPVAGSFEMKFLAQTYNDIFEQQTLHAEKLTYTATHDALTGCYNRRAYESFCESCDENTLGVLMIDVDKFKQFNDSYGHDVGDAVLKRVAQVLQTSFRSNDFVSRIGGDEFCVIMMRVDSRMTELVANKVKAALEQLKEPVDGLPSISLSVGVAFGDRKNPHGNIFKDADTALYDVKRTGRGGCRFY